VTPSVDPFAAPSPFLRPFDEWKHGSFGTKIEKAMEYKRGGCSILVVAEACWTRSLKT
jgi:hypothetical protein